MVFSIALALASALLLAGHYLSQLAAKRHEQHLNQLQSGRPLALQVTRQP
jgi:hypothetical protein